MPISIAFFALITVVFGPVIIPIGTLYQIYGLSVQLYEIIIALTKVSFRIAKTKLTQICESMMKISIF